MVTRLDFLRACLAAVAVNGAPRASSESTQTALDRYVARPTPEYRFDVVDTLRGNGYRCRIVSMVSQKWRSSSEVDRPLWSHWLTLTEPDRIRTSIGILVLSGGSNTDGPPRKVDPEIAEIAVRTGAVVAELHAVPNQPLKFSDERGTRSEDDLIAYSWDKYLRTGDDSWPLRLPMVKAAIRAMDTITALSTVDRFVVGGSSKRGWTAWLTAAADKRVVAIVPVVVDVLNVEQQALHAYRVYGAWPEALRPYEKMGIMKWLGTPQFAALLRIEDPYSYRERLTAAKLIVNSTGDQYFTPDSSQFYFGGLLGEKHLRYVPNTDHSLSGPGINPAQSAVAFLDCLIGGVPRPVYDWQIDSDGTVRIHSTVEPLSAKLWRAENPHSRDFRMQTIGRVFQGAELRDLGGFTYAANVPPPKRGFAAYFIELTFAMPHGDKFVVSTGVRVTPDTFAFGPPPAP